MIEVHFRSRHGDDMPEPEIVEHRREAVTDAPPPPHLRVVVGYDGTHPAMRALDAAVHLIQGREGSIEVVYVANTPSVDLLVAYATGDGRAVLDETALNLRAAACVTLNDRGVAWEFHRRNGRVHTELIAAATAIGDKNPGDVVILVVGSSFQAAHRVMGSAAVSLARNCPVPLVIVP